MEAAFLGISSNSQYHLWLASGRHLRREKEREGVTPLTPTRLLWGSRIQPSGVRWRSKSKKKGAGHRRPARTRLESFAGQHPTVRREDLLFLKLCRPHVFSPSETFGEDSKDMMGCSRASRTRTLASTTRNLRARSKPVVCISTTVALHKHKEAMIHSPSRRRQHEGGRRPTPAGSPPPLGEQ